uniref:Innexin n=1 Tax=Heterorhabditis bacteriophora TaxID=37862 RepID=A0A1I7X069_HETBA
MHMNQTSAQFRDAHSRKRSAPGVLPVALALHMMNKKLVQSQLEKGEFQYVNGGIARTILICVVVSVIVQLGLPFLASYGRDLCSFTPYIIRNTFCADRESVYDKRLTISKQSSASYLPELFPIETWKVVDFILAYCLSFLLISTI